MMKKDKTRKALEKSKKKILKQIQEETLSSPDGLSDENKSAIPGPLKKNKKVKPPLAETENAADISVSEEKTAPEDKKPVKSKKSKKKTKSDEPKKPLSRRIIKQVLKTVFIRVPIFVIVLLLAVFIFLKLFLTPERVESLVTNTFNEMSTGTLKLSVREFSPYGGFVIEDFEILNGAEFDNTPFVSIKRFVVKYEFFKMLLGHIRIPEIGIYSPHIYLTEKNGVWNAERLMKPSDSVEEKEIEEPEEVTEPSDKISLPIAVDLLFKFILDDLHVYAKGSSLRASLEGFSTSAEILVPPVDEIPLSVMAATLFEILEIKVNPAEKLNLAFYSADAEVSPPLLLMWQLVYNQGDTNIQPSFNSSLLCGTNRNPIRVQGTYLAPLSFLVSYNLFYSPVDDKLNLDHLRITFNNKNWINLGGTVDKVTSDPYINIKMHESVIDLRALYPYYLSLTKDRDLRFSGEISLYPFTVLGSLSRLDIDGAVVMRNIQLRLAGAGIDLNLPSFGLAYNAKLSGNDIHAHADMNIPHMYFSMKGDRSGDNGFRLTADVRAPEMGKSIHIDKMSLRYYYPVTGANALMIDLAGRINTASAISGNVDIPKIYLNMIPLKEMLPVSIAKNLDGIPIVQPVNINLSADFNLGDPVLEAGLSMLVKVPDFNVNDLKLSTKVRQNAKNQCVYLDAFRLSSAAWNGALTASGFVDLTKAPIANSDLKMSLVVKAPEKRRVYNDIDLLGTIDISAAMKGDLDSGTAEGAVKIDNFNMESDSMMLALKGFNLNFPFKYYFKTKPGESLLAVSKSQVIDNDFFRQQPNFTLASVKAKHPARNITIEYMKNFEAYMAFKDNIFQIANMKAYVLDGALYGRRILFDIAGLDTKKMEYLLELDMTNVDINRLDKPLQKEKTREAELSLNMNFSGKGLDINDQLTATGYVNIHKIGKDFANSLMKGLNETEGKSTLGIVQPVLDNTMSVKSFNFNLDKGLVYATVTLERRILSYLLATKIQNNKIDFERVTIQEYLRRVKSGGAQ